MWTSSAFFTSGHLLVKEACKIIIEILPFLPICSRTCNSRWLMSLLLQFIVGKRFLYGSAISMHRVACRRILIRGRYTGWYGKLVTHRWPILQSRASSLVSKNAVDYPQASAILCEWWWVSKETFQSIYRQLHLLPYGSLANSDSTSCLWIVKKLKYV